jgi:hypothetical protein
METVGFYVKPAGTKATLKLTPNMQVVTYVVFVRQWNAGVATPVATWFPADLEAGMSITLVQSDGYEFLLKAQITGNPDIAAIDARFSLDETTKAETLALPAEEGIVVERKWTVIIN